MGWKDQLRASRAEKDEFLAKNPRSPIAPSVRDAFDGLVYFPPDADYRVMATVTTHDDPESVELDAENSPGERLVRAITFGFELPRDTANGATNAPRESADDSTDRIEQTLVGYRREPDDTALFVPFRDKTTGQETYRNGRYMDVHPERPLSDGETVTLDFNLAYTPLCAFDNAFVCPLPPEENWLSVAVRAGERTPPVSATDDTQ